MPDARAKGRTLLSFEASELPAHVDVAHAAVKAVARFHAAVLRVGPLAP